jgi:hypothetical protein
MGEVIVLSVGEDCRVAGLLQGSVTYAGMPHEGAYSIVHKKEIGGHYAYNLFFPRYVCNFTIGGISFLIQDVTPEKIAFRMEQAILNGTRHSAPQAVHA